METLCENVLDAIAEGTITESQGMFILCAHNMVDYPIEAEDLLELTKLKYIIGGRVGKKLYMATSPHNDKLTGTIQPVYELDLSKQVVVKLAKLLCVIGKDKKPQLPGSKAQGDTVEYTAKHFLRGEGLIAYHYVVFLFLFPVKGKTNRKWEKHFFGFEYKGARIRTRSVGTAGKFKKIVKKHDMGAFLYGTYLYVKSCIQENKTFIKTMHNYMNEYEDWYLEAYEAIEEAKSVEDLFKKTEAKEGRLNKAF